MSNTPNNPSSPIRSLLVVGANGGIGRQTVELALRDGYHVTALVRNPANLPLTHPQLEIITGDILHPETFEHHLKGKTAVISAIGVKGGLFGDKPTTLYSRGNATLLHAMQRAGARRAFFISASALDVSPVLPWFVRLIAKYVIQRLLRHMYADLRAMEQVIKDTDADWTIIRPPQLTDKASTGHYRWSVNSFLKNCLKISRADVAHFIIHHIDDTATYKGVVEVSY
jgi:putative NADH-flavin reductase